jgi:chemotaxis family two-component system response regulator Rcp1
MAIDILLIEDHPGDARLTQEAFADCARPIRLHHAWDGEEALEFLRREGRHRSDPRLILLDLKLPGLSGHETLALIKGDPNLRAIPVIVLTTSDREADFGELQARSKLPSSNASGVGRFPISDQHHG